MTTGHKNFIVLDIETDGIGSFRPGRQRPIQVSYVKCDHKGNILKTYNKFIKGVYTIRSPVFPADWTLEQINRDGIDIAECVEEIENDIDEHTRIVGHNIDFDIECIVYLCPSTKINQTKRICTMKNSVSFCKIPRKGAGSQYGGYKWPRLAELSKCLDIDVDESRLHDASYDIELTKKSFFKLVQREVISVN